MTTWDERLKCYVEMRRDGTYYGSTPEEARRSADQAEQARVAVHPRQERHKLVIRYTLLTGQLERSGE